MTKSLLSKVLKKKKKGGNCLYIFKLKGKKENYSSTVCSRIHLKYSEDRKRIPMQTFMVLLLLSSKQYIVSTIYTELDSKNRL